MKRPLTLGWLSLLLMLTICAPPEVRAIEFQAARVTPYTMLMDPQKNGIHLEQQRIDYDLTRESSLRIGPYLLDETSVSMQMTREVGEFFDFDFGLGLERKIGPIYVISFRWPTDFVANGLLEIIDDHALSLWRQNVTPEEIGEWAQILAEQTNRDLFNRGQKDFEASMQKEGLAPNSMASKEKLLLAHPQKLSQIHQQTNFGMAHKSFYEIPIVQMQAPFRFCLSHDTEEGRLALCSKRYQMVRESGRYKLMSALGSSHATVKVNDKPVTAKGSAIFLQNDIPIKFSATLSNGTYFEFVSHPKPFSLVDISKSADGKTIEVIGYGEVPMAQINESAYADTVNTGFLNFMPTIGDLKKYWQASLPANTPYVYLKGAGGAPFRQTFNIDNLPPATARIILRDKTPKATYRDHLWVKGAVNSDMKLSADGAPVVRTNPTEFEWALPTPNKGAYNTGVLNVDDGQNVWHSQYDVYRGYPLELSGRLSGVITKDLTLILLGEVAGQYWLEDFFGSQNYRYSRQRWGLAGKYFKALTGTSSNSTNGGFANIRDLEVGNLDLKYRFTPGVWGRDPTIGAMLSVQEITYGYEDVADGFPTVIYRVPVVGGGVFWARSMPKFLDDFFNLVPLLRYPKWVDWEFLYYPFSLKSHQKSDGIFSMNFHGKIQWTQRFFGEMGFGLKNFSFEDTSSRDPNQRLKSSLVLAYGTAGLGFNF